MGAAGYVAPKHLEAIKHHNGNVVAICDPHDSVGVIDRYFPGCLYFREFERLDRFVSCFDEPIDYVVITTPNYLHDSQVRWGLSKGADVICEKPLVCHERNIDQLKKAESESKGRVHVILQCRIHPDIVYLRNVFRTWSRISMDLRSHGLQGSLVYNTPRGPWYDYSWKGETEKSGGLATNIGIHMFDLLVFVFGNPRLIDIGMKTRHRVKGALHWDENVKMGFDLSVSFDQPKQRQLSLFGGFGTPTVTDTPNIIDFTEGFEDLHTEYYGYILDGKAYGIEDIRMATRISEVIRNGFGPVGLGRACSHLPGFGEPGLRNFTFSGNQADDGKKVEENECPPSFDLCRRSGCQDRQGYPGVDVLCDQGDCPHRQRG
jgi:UDP-N-acetyl-2-amino-2-deoxyglucuronate dehydrogenase